MEKRDSNWWRKRRNDFPSLKREHKGYPLAYFDGPGGTQVPQAVIDAISHYYTFCNANTEGLFPTSEDTEQLIEESRERVAQFLGAKNSREISFGQNMTTLNFSLARAIGEILKPGDEVVITQLDHEANRGPWLELRKSGVVVREVSLRSDGTLDMDDFQRKIGERTRLVAMGYASNCLGTVNDVQTVRRWTYQVGSWLLVDAVHYAPHFPLAVQSLGLDFLLCSAYKFYGPHVGILYCKEDLLDQLPTERLRVQVPRAPYRIETGTLNHAAIAGVKAAIEYIATFREPKLEEEKGLRTCLVSAMNSISSFEHELAKKIYSGLNQIPGVKIYGPSFDLSPRAPTISFTIEGWDPASACSYLAGKGICAWNGHFYAIRPVEILGLLEKGGLIRVGVSLYNIEEEVERLLEAVGEMSKKGGKLS